MPSNPAKKRLQNKQYIKHRKAEDDEAYKEYHRRKQREYYKKKMEAMDEEQLAEHRELHRKAMARSRMRAANRIKDFDQEELPAQSGCGAAVAMRPQSTLSRRDAARQREAKKKEAALAALKAKAQEDSRKIKRLQQQLRRSQQKSSVQQSSQESDQVTKVLLTKKRRQPTQRLIREICKNIRTIRQRRKVMKRLRCTRKVFQSKMPRKVNLVKEAVADFLCDDENSRATAGKKETIQRGSKKRQKRILLYGMEVLYSKFMAHHPTLKLSRASFYRHRPKHVVAPTTADRQQCLCQKCENLDLLVEGLHVVRLVAVNDKHALLLSVTCCEESPACLTRQCPACHQKSPIDAEVEAGSPIVEYGKWTAREDRSGTHIVIKTVTCEVAVRKFQKHLCIYGAHFRRLRNQFRAIRQLRSSLKPGHLVLHVDFSEGYLAKYHRETQSAHFGDRDQITIHQGVAYMAGRPAQCFASLSMDKDKKAEAIAAHLQPVLLHFLDNGVEIDRVSFVSDSPSSQYRNRLTLYIVDRLLRRLNIIRWQWLYTEAGHGKGAADGVGAAIKRRCDERVLTGEKKAIATVQDVKAAVEDAKELNILLFEVKTADIAENADVLKTVSLSPMHGIVNTHHACRRDSSGIVYRELTCLSHEDVDECQCHNSKFWSVMDPMSRSGRRRRPTENAARVKDAEEIGASVLTSTGARDRNCGRGRGARRGRGRGSIGGQSGVQNEPLIRVSFQ